jgi:hypothetical protein
MQRTMLEAGGASIAPRACSWPCGPSLQCVHHCRTGVPCSCSALQL